MRPKMSDAAPLYGYAILAAAIVVLAAICAAVWHGIGSAIGALAC